jgi:uncharacterized membrane protein
MASLLILLLIGLVVWVALGLKKANRQIKDLEGRIATLQLDLRGVRLRQASTHTEVPASPSPGEVSPTWALGESGSEDPGAILSSAPLGQRRPAEDVPSRFTPAAERVETPPTSPVPGQAGALQSPEPAMDTQGQQPLPLPPLRPRAIPSINWEQFMGVKLFAWLGGLGLFLGIALFVKYSFEHDLIPPEVRVALGFLVGLALLVAGLLMAGKRYDVTSQTLCGTGVVILYAVTFACRSVYHFRFFDLIPTFLLMVLITATAFLLAVRMNALVVAILGILGGFLTPALLSTGQDNPLGLFGYIALLDVGLVAVAFHRRWHFLALLGAVGTILMEFGWVATFFAVPKVITAITIFIVFDILFVVSFLWDEHLAKVDKWVSAAAILPPLASLICASYLLAFPELGQRPGLVFGFVLGADLCLLALVWMREELAPLQLGAGMAVFALLAAWTLRHLTPELLEWGLGLYLVFAVLHSAFPAVLERLRPRIPPAWWVHLFPALALLLVMAPIVNGTMLSLVVWPVVLVIDLLAILLAVIIPSALSILGVLLLTVAATAIWIVQAPARLAVLPSTLFIIGGFAVFFLVAGLLAGRKILGETLAVPTVMPHADGPAWPGAAFSAEVLTQLPALSATLPFLLLIMLTARLPLADPSPVFGLALLLAVLLLGLARWLEMDWLPAVGLACALALEHAWHAQHFQPVYALVPLGWYMCFFAIFWVFPFLLRPPLSGRVVPCAVAALSGPLHFYLVYRLISAAYPNNYMGLLPAAFALPTLVGLILLLRTVPAGSPTRNSQLAWFGGSILFFITLIFPIQFARQWITIGWALEGAALLWLFHRVPHPGLPIIGTALLFVAFGRLALNPAVLTYHPRSATPIVNWYLYAYGIATACLFVGARLLAPPRHLLFSWNVPPVLIGLGTLLAFLLVNIEIADYFTETGSALTFQFAGNLAQDMTYSITWALFALALILVGLARRLTVARYAGLGLLSLTLLKLFLHDLARLAQLYRIGALLGVAVIAILASFLYQRFLAKEARHDEPTATRR